jgi:DNA-binding GntR family transcriptional regulator
VSTFHRTSATSPDKQPLSDNSLHTYLIEKARNPHIADFFERHGEYYNALFEWERLDRATQVQEIRDHHEILKALLRRDRHVAEQALANHIPNNLPMLVRIHRDQMRRAAYRDIVQSCINYPIAK